MFRAIYCSLFVLHTLQHFDDNLHRKIKLEVVVTRMTWYEVTVNSLPEDFHGFNYKVKHAYNYINNMDIKIICGNFTS